MSCYYWCLLMLSWMKWWQGSPSIVLSPLTPPLMAPNNMYIRFGFSLFKYKCLFKLVWKLKLERVGLSLIFFWNYILDNEWRIWLNRYLQFFHLQKLIPLEDKKLLALKKLLSRVPGIMLEQKINDQEQNQVKSNLS